MQPVNQQKAIVIVAIVAVAALVATTFFSQGGVIFNLSDEEKAAIEQHQEAIRTSLRFAPEDNVDEEASKIFWKGVFDAGDFDKRVKAEIGADIAYKTPEIPIEKLKITSDVSESAVADYGRRLMALLSNFEQKGKVWAPETWGDSANPISVHSFAGLSQETLEGVYALEVPETAVDLQEAVLVGLEEQNKFIQDQDLAIRNLLPRGSRWNRTTRSFLASKDSVELMTQAVDKIAQTYGHHIVLFEQPQDLKMGIFDVKTANALINPSVPPPVGTGFPVTVTGDAPRFWELLLRNLAAIASTEVIMHYVRKEVGEVQTNLLITNYLHYTDALVNVKYSNDFLKKYVKDVKDQNIIKSLLPQYSCGEVDEAKLRKDLRDKALEYLGFDPKNLDPTDIDFYDKLLKASNPDNAGAAISEDGAILFNWSMAIATESEAQNAASLELFAPGKKVPVTNDQDLKIAQSLGDINSKVQAMMNSVFDVIQPKNTTTGAAGLASLIINSAKSVLQLFGVSNAVVIKEQQTCIKVPVFNPIAVPDLGGDININDSAVQNCIQNPSQCFTPILGYENERWERLSGLAYGSPLR